MSEVGEVCIFTVIILVCGAYMATPMLLSLALFFSFIRFLVYSRIAYLEG